MINNIDQSLELANYIASNEKVLCKLDSCNTKIPLNLMRNHIRKHILQNRIKSDAHCCVFCGIIGCTIKLEVSSGFGKNKTISVNMIAPIITNLARTNLIK